MKSDELLDRCLQAISAGEELPPDLARYLARHQEQRAEIEELLSVAQQVSQFTPAELSVTSRLSMQQRLASRLGFDPAVLDASRSVPAEREHEKEAGRDRTRRRKPLLVLGRVSLAKLRYAPPPSPIDEQSEARIREAFRDLTPEDIRRYIGVRGEDYIYFRQRLPGWEPVFLCMAFVLRGFKRIEKLMSLEG